LIENLAPHTTFSFVDDIIVHGRGVEEKMEKLREVFSRFREAGISLNLEKWDFFKEEVVYLGYLVSSHGVKPNPK
jgi:hypothetical protein